MMKTNFHTHTFRCGHAVGNEEAMVKSAIEEGIEVLGFSEHVPLPRYRKHIFKGMRYTLNHFRSFAVACKAIITNGPAMRMPYKDKQLHLEEVKRLKEKYCDQITIYQGFEAEYFEEYLDYYQGLLNSGEADYLILGNHFNKYTVHTRYYGKMDISDEEIISYKNDLLKALDTNLFSYVAHPDLFMVGKVYFDELCENITREICQKALEKDVPLEVNAGGIRRGYRKVGDEIQYPYPNSHFFDIVGEVGCKVILGIDAHSPDDFNQDDFERLMQDKGIVRNRLKINAAINNAKILVKLEKENRTFEDFLTELIPKPIIHHPQKMEDIPASDGLSTQISKEMKKMGFKFVGPVTIYSFLQAVGLINDHLDTCSFKNGGL